MKYKTLDSETWAKKLWEEATLNWKTRKQDRNYRYYLVKPFLEDSLRGLVKKDGVCFDLGCGDGSETLLLKNILVKQGFTKFLGFDTNKNFIEVARENYPSINFFHNLDISSFVKNNSLEGKADFVSSNFVLQDSPQIWYLVEEQARMLKDEGVSLNIILNPQFVEAMKDKGEVEIAKEVHRNRIDNYLFACKYPIAEKGEPPFYVPYFHRNLSDYVKLFEEYSYIDFVKTIKPSSELLEKAKKEKISPFYDHKFNVYWPEISEIPSCVLVKGVKK